ncbi:MAG: hypothetical protein L7S64_08375, partial [Longimicrobiales bacterium]|nr:hypothetical protein [Longimicrobiales bacterium]
MKKKKPGVLRLILDARLTNRLMKPAPGVCLAGPEAFARMETQLPLGVESDSAAGRRLLEHFAFCLGTADVADAFHRLRISQELSEYFAFPWSLPAQALGLPGSVISGITVAADTEIYPCSGSLPMGFSWSLYFCQDIVEIWLGSLSLTSMSRLLNDRTGVAVMDVERYQRDAVQVEPDKSVDFHYAYVDNMGVFAPRIGAVRDALDEAKQAFEGNGLVLHEIELYEGGADTLGVAVGSRGLFTAPTTKRLRILRRALGGFLSLSYCTGVVVEVLLGHCTYAALTCRPLLSVFCAAYAFVRKAGPDAWKIWPAVREEFRHFRALLALCRSDWTRQWSGYVYASDASETGFGIATAYWPRDVVSACGRTTERSRFKRLPGASARVHALEAAGFELHDKKWVPTAVLPEHHEAVFGEWEVRDGFPEIPAEWLRTERWQTRLAKPWHFSDGILHLEARALVVAVQRVAESAFGKNVCQLFLVDNMSVCLSFERARSRDYRLLCLIRRFSAYLLSRNIRASVRWVPSELNSADKGSRLADSDYDPSKELTYFIPKPSGTVSAACGEPEARRLGSDGSTTEDGGGETGSDSHESGDQPAETSSEEADEAPGESGPGAAAYAEPEAEEEPYSLGPQLGGALEASCYGPCRAARRVGRRRPRRHTEVHRRRTSEGGVEQFGRGHRAVVAGEQEDAKLTTPSAFPRADVCG